MNKKNIRFALQTTLPIAASYIPLAAAFGVVFSSLGLPWWVAPLTGLTIYSGALQFLSVELLQSQASYTAILISSFLLGVRHIFYGLPLLGVYRTTFFKKLYLIYSLTDETFGLMMGNKNKTDLDGFLLISLLNQMYWIGGCAIGGYLGAELGNKIKGFEFVLTALFAVLAVEQYLANRKNAFFVALSGAIVCCLLIEDYLLVGAIGLSCAYILLKEKPWRSATRT